MHEVVDHAAGDLGGRHGGQFDALVLLHLGGGGAEHVDQRDRTGPAAAGLFTGEDQEVLTVTAHAGREVVELEERGQLVRVGLAGLQLGDERELTLDEALGTAREVGEHRVDVASQEGLFGGEADGLAVHVVEGRGHLADLVPGVHTDRLHGRVDVLRVGLGELLDQLGQPVLGDLVGGLLEAAQRADHGPGDDEGADEGDTEHEQDQRTGDDRLALRGGAQLAGLLLHVLKQRVLDLLHLLDLRRAVVHPVLVGPLVQRGQTVRVVEDALRVGVGRLDGRVAVLDGRDEFLGALGAVDVAEDAQFRLLALQGGVGVEPVVVGELAQLGVVVRQGRRDHRALDGGELLGGGEGRQGAGALDHLRVAGGLRHVLREVEQLGDQPVVGVDRLGRVLLRLVRRLPDLVEVVQLGRETDQALPDALEVAALAGAVDLFRGVDEVVAGPVGLLLVALDLVVGGLGPVREGAGRLVALLLERGGQLRGLLGHVRQQLHVVELLDVGHGVADAQGTERGGRDHREREQRHQARGDAPVAQSDARAGSGRTRRRLHRGHGGRGCGRTGATGASTVS